ncbi:hypothetical protein C1H46_019814 [Malus baccata]|uniref:Uncharacterized protein n=1 Tax=Malus baccata TaxID=106549 RepID=A0A540M7U8_MALBA|nr:hypothetical protein C1H46_019814 [Malus baccata]
MGDLQVVGGIKKLNNKNYYTWSTCMKSYLQGQDLWDIVSSNEVTQLFTQLIAYLAWVANLTPPTQTSRERKIKEGKAMFALKATVEDDMLEYIWKAKTPKEAWDTFATLFSNRKVARLQLLENELFSVAQGDMTIAEYFYKVKSICRELSELDPTAPIAESKEKRIIIHGLRPEYRGIVVAIQGWQTQPSLVEFENLLADQEALAKQMAEVSLRGDEESLYTKSKGSFKQRANGGSKRNGDKKKGHQGGISIDVYVED